MKLYLLSINTSIRNLKTLIQYKSNYETWICVFKIEPTWIGDQLFQEGVFLISIIYLEILDLYRRIVESLSWVANFILEFATTINF